MVGEARAPEHSLLPCGKAAASRSVLPSMRCDSAIGHVVTRERRRAGAAERVQRMGGEMDRGCCGLCSSSTSSGAIGRPLPKRALEIGVAHAELHGVLVVAVAGDLGRQEPPLTLR
jgi:hypothetical protein